MPQDPNPARRTWRMGSYLPVAPTERRTGAPDRREDVERKQTTPDRRDGDRRRTHAIRRS